MPRFLSLLLLASLAAADQSPIDRAKDLRDVGRDALLKGDLPRARAALEEAVVDDFFNQDIWFLLGHTLDRQGEPQAAFLAWEYGRRLWPEKVVEYFPAEEYGRPKPVQDLSSARLDTLRAMIAKGDPAPEMLREAASVCVALERWEDARGYLAQLESRGAATTEDWLALVEVLRKLNDESHAREALARGLEATGRAAALVAQESWNLLGEGKLDEAGKVIADGLAAHPEEPSLWQCAGRLREARDDWKGARDALSEAVRRCPELATVWARISAIDALKLDDPEGAFTAGYQAYRRAPDLRDEEYVEERMHRSLDSVSAARLKAIPDESAASRLINEKNPFRRMEAVAWYGAHPTADGIPVLRCSLADPVSEVRLSSIQALVGRGDPDALGVFVAGLDDPRPVVAASSLYGYVLLQGSNSSARLHAAMRSEFSVVRYAAYLGLWQVRSDSEKAFLTRCLEGESDEGLRRVVHLVIEEK